MSKVPPSELKSGELAKIAGVSTDTIRHYERIGVLRRSRRTAKGYRLFPVEAVERVRLVRRALSVGFSLPELVRILRVRDNGGAPCKDVRKLAESKLQDIEHQIEELTCIRVHLEQMIALWDQQLNKTPDDQPARLLEMLQESPDPQINRRRVQASRKENFR